MGDHERQDVTENLDLTLRQTSLSLQFERSVWRNVGRNVARSYLDMNGQPGTLDLLSNGYVRRRGIDQSELWPLPLSRAPSMSFESGNVALASVGNSWVSGGHGSDDDGEVLQVREESVSVAERNENDAEDIDEVKMAVVEDEVEDKKEDVEDSGIHDGVYFDCSICLNMAKDPIVTCCGHLFCWPCIYRWLHGHSDERECPVCKGAISAKSVTPIYGRGKNITRGTGVDLGIKIPPRPSAQTVQKEVVQRTTLTSPFERELWTLWALIPFRASNESNLMVLSETMKTFSMI